MRAKSAGARTVTESARRAQIVAAAIEVIAEVGLAGATFTRIARQAGLSSTGMISYHFAGKDDLLAACTTEIERVTREFMEPRLAAVDGAAARLRAYVEANVELVARHRSAVRALLDILGNARTPDGHPAVESPVVNDRVALFEAQIRAGQHGGEFTAADPHVTALALIGAIDALVSSDAAAGLGADEITRHGRELADLLLRAVTTTTTATSTATATGGNDHA
jgi:AcrR family transcriptional regulator